MTRRPIDWGFVRSKTWWLVPLSFGFVTFFVVLKYCFTVQWLGFDASLYASAARAWVEGNDPWLTSQNGIYFAAPPPSLLPYLPFIWLPGGLVSLLWVAGSGALAVLTIRTLKLPWWWLLFPPTVDGILVGNANIAVLAALAMNFGRLAPLAPFLKIYAVVPMVGDRQWRSLASAVAVLVATAVVLPWGLWVDRIAEVTANLERVSATTSVYGQPVLMLVSATALLSLGLRRAGWLAVPLLWPHTQLHYAAISVPGLTPYLALAWCYPVPEVWVAAVVALAVFERTIKPWTSPSVIQGGNGAG